MRRLSRAAALSAAALTFCAAGGLAGPSIAQRADSATPISYTDHQGSRLSAESLGLNDLSYPTPAQAFDQQAPVVTHAIAPALPQSVLDQQPGDDESGARPSRSLAELVSAYAGADTPDEETDCLARAVYWESKGEPLAGQLAVADVIINRAQSGGRFPSTICGVVRQRGQFSFVHGGYIPAAPQASRDWRTAVAIAQIARQDLVRDEAPHALFFHARSVRPAWRLVRVAALGNHVFYR
ncbi:MAG: cell wall hydrolase [Sphingomonadaceae bacterium]|nr:cell wall hydrolase [Sphingomonadaceae bacterium]